MERSNSPQLMWVTDRIHSDAPVPELARLASAAGVDLIHIREHGLDPLPLELLVRAIKAVIEPRTSIVLNSNLELARELNVGAHLPESGPTVEAARDTLGAGALIGRSVHSPESAAASKGASYLVAGHVYETSSKAGIAPIGLDGFAGIMAAAPAPVFAIGGVTPARVPELRSRGAVGVAVMSPLTHIESIHQTVVDFRNALERTVTDVKPNTIDATINGKLAVLSAGTTIAAFLAGRELHERLVVVERNGEIVKRDTFADVVIEKGDLLEIVHFVGGG